MAIGHLINRKSSKIDKLLIELKRHLTSIHEANLSKIEDKEIFIDDKLDLCFDILSSILGISIDEELNNEGID